MAALFVPYRLLSSKDLPSSDPGKTTKASKRKNRPGKLIEFCPNKQLSLALMFAFELDYCFYRITCFYTLNSFELIETKTNMTT